MLCGVFPISKVAAIPFCVHRISQLLPLERILSLTHPSTAVEPVEDKRTWRDGQRGNTKGNTDLKWTAIDVMTAYADKKGWVTAKAGRPDINRAGNASEPSWFAFGLTCHLCIQFFDSCHRETFHGHFGHLLVMLWITLTAMEYG